MFGLASNNKKSCLYVVVIEEFENIGGGFRIRTVVKAQRNCFVCGCGTSAYNREEEAELWYKGSDKAAKDEADQGNNIEPRSKDQEDNSCNECYNSRFFGQCKAERHHVLYGLALNDSRSQNATKKILRAVIFHRIDTVPDLRILDILVNETREQLIAFHLHTQQCSAKETYVKTFY